MRKHLLAIVTLVLSTTLGHAQAVSNFDTLHLATSDTFYVNYSNPDHDVSFQDGMAYFPCFYDTAHYGSTIDSFWSSGFVYSNKSDSTTSGYLNEFAAKAYKGYGGSGNYAVAQCFINPVTLTDSVMIYLDSPARGKPVSGFYVSNSTYAYNAIRDGYFNATRFGYTHGDTTGNYPDWFKLTIKAYHGGLLSTDSVDFYLADYRTASKIIVKDWQWVNLLPLGNVDSLLFSLSSSDTAGGFGMNTPAYFCMDNFTANSTLAVKNIPSAPIAKVYPNPAANNLFIELNDNSIKQLNIMDMSGKTIQTCSLSSQKMTISTSALSPGIYLLQLTGDGKVATIRFVKQ